LKNREPDDVFVTTGPRLFIIAKAGIVQTS